MNATIDPDWLNFDIHGIIGVRVHAAAPAALQLRTMMGSFAVEHPVPPDIVVSGDHELMLDAAVLELLHECASGATFRACRAKLVIDHERTHADAPGASLDHRGCSYSGSVFHTKNVRARSSNSPHHFAYSAANSGEV